MTTTIETEKFNEIIDGIPSKLYVLKNNQGIEATISNYGLRLVSLLIPDKKNRFKDIVLGFAQLETYKHIDGAYFGSIVGQYANRIENGRFQLGNQTIQLDQNNESNHLHGGSTGYHEVMWTATHITPNSLTFEKTFHDGCNGYPGNTTVTVTYSLTDKNSFDIDYKATTDAPTIINLTHHSYFNLKGEGNGNIADHKLMINAAQYLPINMQLIPDQGLQPVANTVFDFQTAKTIGEDIDKDHQQLLHAHGYDHNYVLNEIQKDEEGMVLAAIVSEEQSGRVMTVYTNEPGMQFYSGNHISSKLVGKQGNAYEPRSGFCLETQHFPNSPNNADFPSVALDPGENYESKTRYQFSILKEE